MPQHPFNEATLQDEVLFQGKIIDLHKLTVTLPNGRQATREVVRHPGAVAILAETSDGNLLFVEQFRKAPDQVLLELPAGKLDKNEAPAACARRELREETGYSPSMLEQVAEFYTSPGFADEHITLFYASGLVTGELDLDDDEFLNVHTLSKADVQARLAMGAFVDAKTLIGVLWWLLREMHGEDLKGDRA